MADRTVKKKKNSIDDKLVKIGKMLGDVFGNKKFEDANKIAEGSSDLKTLEGSHTNEVKDWPEPKKRMKSNVN